MTGMLFFCAEYDIFAAATAGIKMHHHKEQLLSFVSGFDYSIFFL